jgi:hypothetical protein
VLWDEYDAVIWDLLEQRPDDERGVRPVAASGRED